MGGRLMIPKDCFEIKMSFAPTSDPHSRNCGGSREFFSGMNSGTFLPCFIWPSGPQGITYGGL